MSKKWKLIFSGIGIIALIIAFIFTALQYKFIQTTNSTTGVVSEIRELDGNSVRSGEANKSYNPVISYTIDDLEYKINSKVGSYKAQTDQLGQKVTVFYDPKNPNDAVIKSFWNLWGGGITFLIFGFLFLLPAAIMKNNQ